MPEITLRDLCRWDRRLQLLPPAGMTADAAMDRGVSWAVSARSSPPLLPPLRGGELVVLPKRVLDQIEEAGTSSQEQLLDILAGQNISAILTESGFTEEPLEALPVLTMPAPFPQDAENTLNRLLTERRAELYRLGNDLSRRLSQAAMDPSGVQGLLDVAAELAGRSILLQDSDAQTVARGGSDPVSPATPEDMETARSTDGANVISMGADRERLITPLSAASGTYYLSLTAPAGTLTEVDRLVLTQTSGTAAIVMAQGNAIGARGAREQAIAEVLEGRLASDAAVSARVRGLGLDPSAPVVVGLIGGRGGDQPLERTGDQLLGGLRGAERARIDDEMAFVAPAAQRGEIDSRLSRLVARSSREPPLVVLSEPVESILRAPEALRQARFMLGLLKSGVLEGPVIRSESLDEIGVFGLLFHLWGNPAVESFRRQVLGDLEEYDRRRGTQLIETLEAYLSSGGSLAEAAAMLSVHRNTLSYRINRIAELSGRDLANPRDRLLLRVALLCRDLMKVSG